ncbi:2-hydroxyacyl-CoA dehydratase [Candidatus Peregrinibacteria bacterium]|nr:2-hydroxyacyl-CoA dehydratase [Candidatus Peregrinibacteria bacterium]
MTDIALESIIENCRSRMADVSYSAIRDFKSTHPTSRIIGCFPVYTPVELYDAVGALPLGLFGAEGRVEIVHADARFQSFVCSIARSTLEMLLQNKWDFLDGIVFHSICDVARNLASVVKRNCPKLYVEFIHFPQNTASVTSLNYYISELTRLRKHLEELTGRPFRDEALREAIHKRNLIRREINQLHKIRRETPHLISTSELYAILRAGALMLPDEYYNTLKQVVAGVSQRTRKPKDHIRVIIEGAFCEQPPVDLINVIEEAGCDIVDDDFILGWQWFKEELHVDGKPMETLARAYIENSPPSSVRHCDRQPREAELVKRVRQSKADAVIFTPAKFCEPALFDYVPFKMALEKEGIPHLVVEFEEKMWTFERIRNEVETFVESMLFD